jgi:hypothetical protein
MRYSKEEGESPGGRQDAAADLADGVVSGPGPRAAQIPCPGICRAPVTGALASQPRDVRSRDAPAGVEKQPRGAGDLVQIVGCVILEEDDQVSRGDLGLQVVRPANGLTPQRPVGHVWIVVGEIDTAGKQFAAD